MIAVPADKKDELKKEYARMGEKDVGSGDFWS